jgi:two-component system phosphate regulon sensor histidine kinase PhoR
MHEVKTPLLAITTASELLARRADPDEQGLLRLIQKQTDRLSKLTQDFLELSRLESGRVHLQLETVDLAHLVEDVINLEASRAAEKQVALKTEIAADLPLIHVDPGRVQQVLINLVSNAIKYNREEGTVTVCVGIEENEILIQVSDSGWGIESDYLPHLFDRFYRVPDREGSSEGTGLGLPITKKIVEAHNGRIKVTSEPGVGSTFTCTIPLNTIKSQGVHPNSAHIGRTPPMD